MTKSNLFAAALYATSLANIVLANQQPWLDQSLPYEERLQSFIAQLNTTQKLAMTQGDTKVC
jgi:beta-glucosidase